MTVAEAVSGDAGDTEHAEEDEAGADDGDDCIAAALSFDATEHSMGLLILKLIKRLETETRTRLFCEKKIG